VNATTAASTTGQRGSARAAIVAVAFIVAAAVAGVATGNLLQGALNRTNGTVLSTDAYRSLHAMHAIEAAAAAGLSAALATEAYGHERVQALTGPAISDWPDLGARMATPKLISDTFRLTGPSRLQSAGLAAALATEAYGAQHVERMGAAGGSTTTFSTEDYRAQHPVQVIGTPAIEDWPDEGSRLVKPAPVSDTFRFTGPSRVQSAGLAAALATEAYGAQHVERMAAGGSTATFSTEDYRALHPVQAIGTSGIEDWPDYGSRQVKPQPTSDTFRLTGGSRLE
jgi:hypothetical protein